MGEGIKSSIVGPQAGTSIPSYPTTGDFPTPPPQGQLFAVDEANWVLYIWNEDGPAWEAVGPASSGVTVDDTASIDLTLSTNVITGDLNLSAASPDAGHINAVSTIEADGLQVQVPIASTSVTGVLTDTDWDTFNNKQGPISVTDTNSVDLTLTGAAISADLLLSADTPTTGFINATNSIEADGLHTEVPILVGDSGSGGTAGVVPAPGVGDATRFLQGDGTWATPSSGGINVIDTDSIDLTLTGADLEADLNLSVASPDAGHINAVSSIEADGLQVQVPIADTNTTGVLTDTDWDTFNGKQNALSFGNLSTSTTGVSITGGTGSVIGSGSAVDVQTASGSQPGLLSSSDWTTFNGKLTDPMTTRGDMIYRNSSNVTARLPIGSAGQVLTADGTDASWEDPAPPSASSTSNSFINGGFATSQFLSPRNAGAPSGSTPRLVYVCDQWFSRALVQESGGYAGITSEQTDGTMVGSPAALELFVSQNNAPSPSPLQFVMEFMQVLSNKDSLKFYDETASAGVYVTGLGNVNEVRAQFFYATTPGLPTNGIGSEVTVTVNPSTPTLVAINGQAIGTGMTRDGVIGFKVRISGVSSGDPAAEDNGIRIEKAQMNLGATLGEFDYSGSNAETDRMACHAFYEQSYLDGTFPGSVTTDGSFLGIGTAGNYGIVNTRFLAAKNSLPVVKMYSTTGAVDSFRDETAGSDVAANTPEVTAGGFVCSASSLTAGDIYRVQWTADSRIVAEVI